MPGYPWILLASISSFLKISAQLFWSSSTSRLHPACSLSGRALGPLVFFIHSYHRHAKFQIFLFFSFPKGTIMKKLHLRQDGSSASERNPKQPLGHGYLQSHTSGLFALQHSPSPGSPRSSLPPFLFGLCCCLFISASAGGGQGLHCLVHMAMVFYTTSFPSASPDFLLLYPWWYPQCHPTLEVQRDSKVAICIFLPLF